MVHAFAALQIIRVQFKGQRAIMKLCSCICGKACFKQNYLVMKYV
jgi:hypothetical protein